MFLRERSIVEHASLRGLEGGGGANKNSGGEEGGSGHFSTSSAFSMLYILLFYFASVHCFCAFWSVLFGLCFLLGALLCAVLCALLCFMLFVLCAVFFCFLLFFAIVPPFRVTFKSSPTRTPLSGDSRNTRMRRKGENRSLPSSLPPAPLFPSIAIHCHRRV